MHSWRASLRGAKVQKASAQSLYALADMSNQLFVSRYQMQLPGKEEIVAFLHKAVEELGGGDE